MIKAEPSSTKAKLFALSNVRLASTHSKELRDIEHKNKDIMTKLEIVKRGKDHAISQVQSFIDSVVKVVIANDHLGTSIEFKIGKDNTRKKKQNIESKHYKEMRAMSKKNVRLFGTIKKSNYDNEQFLVRKRDE